MVIIKKIIIGLQDVQIPWIEGFSAKLACIDGVKENGRSLKIIYFPFTTRTEYLSGGRGK